MTVNQQMDKMLIDAGFCIGHERRKMIDIAYDTAGKTMGDPVNCLEKMINLIISYEKAETVKESLEEIRE